jgi:hypothetical protein
VRWTLALALVAAVACSAVGSARPAAVPHQLVGTWQIASAKITFNSNGRAAFNLGGAYTIHEKWSATPTTVTFGPADYCEGKGTYSWKVIGPKLRLHAIHDACSIRVGVLNGGTWKKK